MDRLLPLREELGLFHREPDAQGEVSWSVFDPVRNRYFRISQQSLLLMRYWQAGSVTELVREVQQKENLQVDREQVLQLHTFLLDKQLLVVDLEQEVDRLAQQWKHQQQSLMQKILLKYLFFRIPLLRPDRLLEKILAAGRVFLTMRWLQAVLLAGMAGLFLTVRQWDEFINTTAGSFSATGLMYFLIALVFVKSVHELGHGIAAKYYGCRVPSMGVAFLVMFPVLYTDTTDTWRLASYRQRMIVGAAGLCAELIVACLALFIWPFVADGAFKNVVFMLAGVTWISSLLVNLNPFMRFDGYYLLSDWWRIDNLQHRAFALARWQLREWLFSLDEPVPEGWSAGQRKKLLFYAYGTWIYRFLLFLGIAIVVYHFFFKALGLLLFLVEIIWLILRPVYLEIRFWWQHRHKVHWNPRNIATFAFSALFLTLLFIPFNGTLNLPAVMTAKQSVKVFPPESGGIMNELLVTTGQTVTAGQPLFSLSNPDLNHKKKQLLIELNLTQTQLNRKAADINYLQATPVILQRKASHLEALAGLGQQLEELTVRAPFSGKVVFLDEWVTSHQWLHTKIPVLQIASTDSIQIEAYIPATDLNRVTPGNKGIFYPDDLSQPSVELEVSRISPVGAQIMATDYLSSVYGGGIEVTRDQSGHAVPVQGAYRVIFIPLAETVNIDRVLTGSVRLDVKGRSYFTRFWNAFWNVVIRESGF